MIAMRIVEGIRSHFPVRALEWYLAGIIFAFGWQLILDPPNFGASAYQPMLVYASEFKWGAGCMMLGGARLIALFVNGSFAGTAYSRWSPHVRATAAFASCFFWSQATLSVWAGNPGATIVVFFTGSLIADIYNVYRCSVDAKEVDKAQLHGEP